MKISRILIHLLDSFLEKVLLWKVGFSQVWFVGYVHLL